MIRRLLPVSCAGPLFGLAVGLASASSPERIGAQTVVITVVEAETSRPLVGAFVLVRDASGAVVRSALTDGGGRLTLAALPAGRFTLEAEMIGRTSVTTEPFVLPASEIVLRRIALPSRALSIEGLLVEGEARCQVRPSENGGAATLWDEARKALEVAAAMQARGAFRYELESLEREYALDGVRVVRDERARQSGYSREPYRSRAPEELAQGGFVRHVGDDSVAVAPDAAVLLSDAFLDTHCFRVQRGRTPELVGLRFEPVRRGSKADVEGVLWLSSATAALRSVEFRYTGSSFDALPREAGGEVAFERLPSGAWVVRRWLIRMPLLEELVRAVGSRRTTVLEATGFLEVGGEVVSVRDRDGRTVVQADRATLAGLVFDSVSGGPLPGASVALTGSGWSAFTDTDGRFTIPELPEGRYRVAVSHPLLDSLDLDVPDVEIELRPGRTEWLDVLVPRTTATLEGGAPFVAGYLRTAGAPPPMIVALDGAGSEVARTLPDRSGRFRLRLPAAGRFRLRTVRPGRTFVDTEPFTLPEGRARTVLLAAGDQPAARLSAAAESSVCTVRPGPESSAGSAWQEVAKALEAVRWTRAQRRLAHELVLFRREWSREGRMVGEEEAERVPGLVEPTFPERPPRDLVERGFVLRGEDSDTAHVFAPLPEVLLSDAFLDSHCFRMVPPRRSPTARVGLAFQPTDSAVDRADVIGVFWLDERTGLLEALDYRYTSLPDAPGVSAGGWMGYAPVEDGSWMIAEWGSRIPLVAEIVDPQGRDRRAVVVEVATVHEDGGVVRATVGPDGEPLRAPVYEVPDGVRVEAIWARGEWALRRQPGLPPGGNSSSM